MFTEHKETKFNYRFSQIYHNLTLMNFAPNLPEQPTFKMSKFQESLQGNLSF